MSNIRLRESIGEIVGGAVLSALGIVWAVTSSDYGIIGDGGRLAPGTLPFACGVGLALTGAAIAIKAVVTRNRASVDSDAADGSTNEVAGAANAASATSVATATVAPATPLTAMQRVRSVPKQYPIATVYGLVVLSVLVMPVLGFAAAFALGIFAILRVVERQSLRTSALVGIITALLGYVLFEVIFNLPLPDPFFL